MIFDNNMYFHETIVKCNHQAESFEHSPKNKLALFHIVYAQYEKNYSIYVIIV